HNHVIKLLHRLRRDVAGVRIPLELPVKADWPHEVLKWLAGCEVRREVNRTLGGRWDVEDGDLLFLLNAKTLQHDHQLVVLLIDIRWEIVVSEGAPCRVIQQCLRSAYYRSDRKNRH